MPNKNNFDLLFILNFFVVIFLEILWKKCTYKSVCVYMCARAHVYVYVFHALKISKYIYNPNLSEKRP